MNGESFLGLCHFSFLCFVKGVEGSSGQAGRSLTLCDQWCREARTLSPEQPSLLGSFKSHPLSGLSMRFSTCPPQRAGRFVWKANILARCHCLGEGKALLISTLYEAHWPDLHHHFPWTFVLLNLFAAVGMGQGRTCSRTVMTQKGPHVSLHCISHTPPSLSAVPGQPALLVPDHSF